MDLFGEEQQVYERAASHIKSVEDGGAYDFEEFKVLAGEYRDLLKQLRRITRMSDRTVDGLHENNLELIDKVHYDTLTGIYNRRYMEEELERRIRSLAHSNGRMSIMIMDIDFFKRYNDAYGHSAGDDCLRAVAKALDGCIAQNDNFVARYGGEEFVAVLSHMDEAEAVTMAEKILEAVRGLEIIHENNEAAGCVTISIGVTTVRVKQNHSYVDYIKRADAALYDSKRNGRNKYTFIKYREGTK